MDRQAEIPAHRPRQPRPGLFVVCDAESRLVLANEPYARCFGVRPDDLVGRPVQSVMGDAAWALMRPHVERALEGSDDCFEADMDWTGEGRRRLAVSCSPRRAREGVIDGWTAVMNDVTEAAEMLAERALSDQLLASVPVGWALLDRDLRYRRVSDYLAAINGPPAAAHIGRLRAEMVPDIADETQPLLEAALRDGASLRDREVSRRLPGGRSGHYLMSAHPLHGVDGERTGISVVVVDITARKAMEDALAASELRFRGLAEGMPHIVWECDTVGRCNYVNRVWEAYTGAPAGDALGMGWLQRFHPDDAPRVEAEWLGVVGARGQDAFETHARLRGRDGGHRWFRITGSPILDPQGRILRWVGACTDVDDARRALDALREADRRKDEFLAMLAHELRNPLAPLRTASEIMQRIPVDDPHLAWTGEVVGRQVEHLRRLVDDLLDVSRITRGLVSLKKSPVLLGDVVARAVEQSRPELSARAHALELSVASEPVWLEGDATRLTQVLSNLLHNAAKYTPEHGRVRLCAGVEAAQAVVTVEDNGIGISAQLLPRVFDLFTQGEQALSRGAGGLGLGLTLVERLVQLHGGTVAAESAGPGLGARFTVRLPLARAPAPPAAEPAPCAARAANSGLRVLVVDDNSDAADSMAMLLDVSGYDVRVAHDGPSALDAAGDFGPGAALLDIGLPGMDGFELARRLRSRHPRLLLVALTGYGQEEDRVRAREAGFDHHLVKPADIAAVLALLAGCQATP